MFSFLDHVDSNGTENASQVPTLSTNVSHLKLLFLGAFNEQRFCSRGVALPWSLCAKENVLTQTLLFSGIFFDFIDILFSFFQYFFIVCLTYLHLGFLYLH